MLFWIILVIAIVGIIWVNVDDLNFVAVMFCVSGIIATIISLIFLASAYIGNDGYIAENKVRYDSLVYQYENDIYENDNDIGKYELMMAIQDWNEDLARYRENQDDFWIGIYIPDIYDQFEFIELK